ncbi:MAG: hypothetical protein K2X87_30955 [Gemmataceae bacterium]|nr:hypothetical protein [Gemmataceae bacterium]
MTVAAVLLVGLAVGLPQAPPPRPAPPPVGPVPAAVREAFRLDPFYLKYADAGGVPVVASAAVDDRAVSQAAATVERMLANRPDVLEALAKARVRVAVIGKAERTTQLPEYAGLRDEADYWDRRARGLGATRAAPASSVGEENLLGLTGDRYRGESIMVHEFAHTLHTMGLNRVDRGFEPRLREAFAAAKQRGLWPDTYAATNPLEYWAEGVQSYFDCNQKPQPGVHNEVATGPALKRYDPDLYDLIDATLKSPPWRWTDPGGRGQ